MTYRYLITGMGGGGATKPELRGRGQIKIYPYKKNNVIYNRANGRKECDIIECHITIAIYDQEV